MTVHIRDPCDQEVWGRETANLEVSLGFENLSQKEGEKRERIEAWVARCGTEEKQASDGCCSSYSREKQAQ